MLVVLAQALSPNQKILLFLVVFVVRLAVIGVGLFIFIVGLYLFIKKDEGYTSLDWQSLGMHIRLLKASPGLLVMTLGCMLIIVMLYRAYISIDDVGGTTQVACDAE